VGVGGIGEGVGGSGVGVGGSGVGVGGFGVAVGGMGVGVGASGVAVGGPGPCPQAATKSKVRPKAITTVNQPNLRIILQLPSPATSQLPFCNQAL
jgi:hypothetical protein